jgi:hypothetical protein
MESKELKPAKQALADAINQNGGWVDWAKFSSQDKEGNTVCFYSNSKPTAPSRGELKWKSPIGTGYMGDCDINAESLITNWHQCALSREEYYQAYPKADADGWIAWKCGECPTSGWVDFKRADGIVYVHTMAEWLDWGDRDERCGIVAYRLHKPETKPEFCEPVMRSIPDPESKPTIEQLAQDYRNAKDYAARLQKEANDAAKTADTKLGELERAGEAIGLLIGVARMDSTKAIKDWRDLMAGDEIICSKDGNWNCDLLGNVCVVREIESPEYTGCMPILAAYGDARDWGDKFTFVRRP